MILFRNSYIFKEQNDNSKAYDITSATLVAGTSPSYGHPNTQDT